jgi:hypothetical protein
MTKLDLEIFKLINRMTKLDSEILKSQMIIFLIVGGNGNNGCAI